MVSARLPSKSIPHVWKLNSFENYFSIKYQCFINEQKLHCHCRSRNVKQRISRIDCSIESRRIQNSSTYQIHPFQQWSSISMNSFYIRKWNENKFHIFLISEFLLTFSFSIFKWYQQLFQCIHTVHKCKIGCLLCEEFRWNSFRRKEKLEYS